MDISLKKRKKKLEHPSYDLWSGEEYEYLNIHDYIKYFTTPKM